MNPRDVLLMESSEDAAGAVTLVLGGEIDFENVAQLRAKLSEVIGTSHGNLTVDLGGVSFLDSTTVGVLIQAKKRLAQRDSNLVLTNVGPRVRRIFEVAGLVDYLGVS